MPDIKIRIEKPKEAKADNQPTSTTSDLKESVAMQTIFAQQMIATAKQTISYQASNIANYTGNYLMQDQVNQTLDIINDISSIVTGVLSTKSWVGGAIAIYGIASKKVFEFMSVQTENRILQMEQDYLVKRSGNSTTNGSRGTEN